MIKQKDIDWVDSWELRSFEQVHPSHRMAVIQLSLLGELRQQLLYELKNNLLNKRKFNSELESLQNTFVFDACRIVRKVLCVEGEKDE